MPDNNTELLAAIDNYIISGGDTNPNSDSALLYGFPIGTWCVGDVQDFSFAFQSYTEFNEALNDWNTSSATDMSFMFENAESFNQPLDNWDVRYVTLGCLGFVKLTRILTHVIPLQHLHHADKSIPWSPCLLPPSPLIKIFPGKTYSAKRCLCLYLFRTCTSNQLVSFSRTSFYSWLVESLRTAVRYKSERIGSFAIVFHGVISHAASFLFPNRCLRSWKRPSLIR